MSTINGYAYVEFVGTGIVATAVLFSSAFAAMFGTFVKYQFQRTYDAILAARWTPRSSSPPSALDRARAGVYGCVPMIVAIFVRARPGVGDARCAVHRLAHGLGWASFGIMIAGFAKSFENFNYVVSAVLTPLFLVAGTFFPLDGFPEWVQVLAAFNPLYQLRRAGPRRGALRVRAGSICHASAFLVVFALLMWRIAIHAMDRKLID